MLNTKTEIFADAAVVYCSGRIVRGAEAILCLAVTSQVDKRTIVVDLADVRMVDAAGLGVFAMLAWWARAQEIELILANPNSYVRKLVEITKLDTVLQVCSDLEAQAAGT
jgi:anti-anti-sigma factor